MEYKIKQLLFDDGLISLQKVVDLQNIVYNSKHIFTVEGFKHWYLDNPMGKVISFNAFYEEELVAHYACIPYKMNIAGRIVLGLFDMATVTHPDHRGKGLFKQLAKITYEFAKNNGFEFVIGVANANSFPGYMKYFPFTFISKLDVKLGIGNSIHSNGRKIYSTFWDKNSLEWRLNCFKGNYFRQGDSIIGKLKFGIKTFMCDFPTEFISNINIVENKNIYLKLYVGLGANIKSFYFNVPKFIKHSPFNLIFLDLTDGKLPLINRDNIFFQLIDFDVA